MPQKGPVTTVANISDKQPKQNKQKKKFKDGSYLEENELYVQNIFLYISKRHF